ncbi:MULTISPECIES: hypothetical protein [Rhodomicrobium]|uniref:hypothetical protein n=1 Tax=Rhodomicrobium TaxID=1068 RepID=UPI000F7460AF|nr:MULTISPECIES: hypothetical protein [Rhodomicrobium]
MIFEVSPSQIESLDSNGLAELLRRLVYAEAQLSGVSLRGVSVPLQITISDGGEDGRIKWTGGFEQTNYFPSRFSLFQSKATNPPPAKWKEETWTKSSRKKGVTRKLSDAFATLIEEGGSYVGFTSAPIVGRRRYDERIQAIRNGITETGGDPNGLAAIEIYDCNKIADWCSRHPSVAVWLNERQSGLSLGGFQTLEGWRKKADFSEITYVDDLGSRYFLGSRATVSASERRPARKDALVFQQARDRLADHLAEPGACVRLVGPSGIGKSRFASEIFRDLSTVSKEITATSSIYCDYRNVGQDLVQLATALAQASLPALIIADECPREVAVQLGDIASVDGSKFRIVAIDIDDRSIDPAHWLNISMDPGDEAFIEGIVRQKLPAVDALTLSYIKNLCGGYPRMAVLVTENVANKAPILKSLTDVVDRILEGCRINEREQLRAIECLALFDHLAPDGPYADQFDLAASRLAELSGDRMYEYVAEASQHPLVARIDTQFSVQPIPISAFLGTRRLDLLRVSTVMSFVDAAPPLLLESFFRQWRYFDRSMTAKAVAQQLLSRDGRYGTFEAINTETGAKAFDALVHVVPEAATDSVQRIFSGRSVDQLDELIAGKYYFVRSLQRLAFRNRSFPIAARILMRLAALEVGEGGEATQAFTGFYQIALSGTEADPTERFALLDEGLASEDDRIILLCIRALDDTLKRQFFSRSNDAEQIGSGPPLRDWSPKTWAEVAEFHRQGLARLNALRGRGGEIAAQCEDVIARHLRGLLSANLFADLKSVVSKIAAERGLWLEAIRSVGDWLYFDRSKASEELSGNVRALYDSLIPTDLLEQALLYTKFWSAQLRDPNALYSAQGGAAHREYSTQKSREIAAQIAVDTKITEEALKALAGQDLHNAYAFAQELGLKAVDPTAAFAAAVQGYEMSSTRKGMQLIRGLLNGIDQRNQTIAEKCLKMALDSQALKDQVIDLYSATPLTPQRLAQIVLRLRDGTIIPTSTAFLSYGKGLDHLTPSDILPLLNELAQNHGANGAWTALEITSMYQLGRTDLEQTIELFLKAHLTSPALLGKITQGDRDGYLFESLVELIKNKGTLDKQFASDLAEQIVRICQIADFDAFYSLCDPARKIIGLLAKAQPSAMWSVLSHFFEQATPSERNRLEKLIGPAEFDDNHNAAGPLFDVPEAEMVEWAAANPDSRAAFLCMFYPLISNDAGEGATWHPALERLAARFGESEAFRRALARRMRPSSWSGSIVPILEAYLDPLEKWFTHAIARLALWARETHRELEREIAAEQEA